MQDMKISGSGTIAPGTYGKVSISGSGQASGPIDCEDFIISGSGRVTGPHLHYEIIYRKDYVNPALYMDLDIPSKDYMEMVRKPEDK